MYGFTDKTLMQTLATESLNGKKIRLLLEFNPFKADNENKKAIHFFEKTPISLTKPASTFRCFHQKTFLFDHKTAWIMTFNLTHSAFSKQRNVALSITDPALVNEIQRVFNADRAHHTVPVSEPRLIWSPDNSRQKISSEIEQAKKTILIETENISDYHIMALLEKAAKQHVHVDILLSSTPREKALRYLSQAGVVVHQSHHYIIHSKIMIIDHEKAIIGSINLTTPSLDENRELSVITTEKKVICALTNTFQHDWEMSS